MVILKSTMTYTGHSHFWLTHNHNTHPSYETTSKISPILTFLEYTSAANHGLFEKDELYGVYVDSHQVNVCDDVTALVLQAVGHGRYCIHYLAHILY